MYVKMPALTRCLWANVRPVRHPMASCSESTTNWLTWCGTHASGVGRTPEALEHRTEPIPPVLEFPPNHQVVGVSYLVAEILDNRVEHLSEQLNVAIIKVE